MAISVASMAGDGGLSDDEAGEHRPDPSAHPVDDRIASVEAGDDPPPHRGPVLDEEEGDEEAEHDGGDQSDDGRQDLQRAAEQQVDDAADSVGRGVLQRLHVLRLRSPCRRPPRPTCYARPRSAIRSPTIDRRRRRWSTTPHRRERRGAPERPSPAAAAGGRPRSPNHLATGPRTHVNNSPRTTGRMTAPSPTMPATTSAPATMMMTPRQAMPPRRSNHNGGSQRLTAVNLLRGSARERDSQRRTGRPSARRTRRRPPRSGVGPLAAQNGAVDDDVVVSRRGSWPSRLRTPRR